MFEKKKLTHNKRFEITNIQNICGYVRKVFEIGKLCHVVMKERSTFSGIEMNINKALGNNDIKQQ
jgi:hypothetical protein